MLKAAGAASRNNRATEAREYAAIADTAESRLQREHQGLSGHKTFGPLTAALMRWEVELLDDRPDRVLELARTMPQNTGRTNSSTWNRHRLDLARAHLRTGNVDKATEILALLRRDHPEWMRYQQYAKDIVREVLAARPRMPNEEQRQLADFMKIEG
ncbi:MAG: hypothetical protein ACRDOO_05825 [Actinomadura sp.]